MRQKRKIRVASPPWDPQNLAMSDYDRIATAIEFITQHAHDQPSLEAVAAHAHLSPFHFQRLFTRWAGVSPKRFLQVLTVERAKRLLRQSQSLLDVAHEVGLSGGSRLHDHFVRLEAVTPGQFKTGGQAVEIGYAVRETPFGVAFVATTPRGICRLEFLDPEDNRQERLADLAKQWPNATLHEERAAGAALDSLFDDRPPSSSLSLQVTGTNFQIMVWKALLQIPPGQVVSYGQVADFVGHPGAARAVGTAVGANPVALLIPCHRVIRQSGELGGYRWGETRKHAIHAWEAARLP